MNSPKLRSAILRPHEAAAIVAGRQTQIRRPAKEWTKWVQRDAWELRNVAGGFECALIGAERGHPIYSPFGRPGDILVGREAYALEHSVEHDDEPPHNDGRPIRWRPESDTEGWIPRWTQAHYRATDPTPELAYEDSEEPGCRWRSPVCMPLEFARIRKPVLRMWVEQIDGIWHWCCEFERYAR